MSSPSETTGHGASVAVRVFLTRHGSGSNRKIQLTLDWIGVGLLLIDEDGGLASWDGFGRDVSNRVMPEAAVSSAWAECSMMTEAIEDLAAQGTLSSRGPRRRCGRDVARRCGRWILLSTKLQPEGPGVTQGRSGPLGGLFRVQSVSVAQVGQIALSACRAIRPPGRIFSNGAANLRLGSGHFGVRCVVESGTKG